MEMGKEQFIKNLIKTNKFIIFLFNLMFQNLLKLLKII